MSEICDKDIILNRSKYWSLKTKISGSEYPISFGLKNLVLTKENKGIYYFDVTQSTISEVVKKEWDNVKRQGKLHNIHVCDLIYKNSINACELSNNTSHTSFFVDGDPMEEMPKGARDVKCSAHFICKSLFEGVGAYGPLLYPQFKILKIKFKTSPLVCSELLPNIIPELEI